MAGDCHARLVPGSGGLALLTVELIDPRPARPRVDAVPAAAEEDLEHGQPRARRTGDQCLRGGDPRHRSRHAHDEGDSVFVQKGMASFPRRCSSRPTRRLRAHEGKNGIFVHDGAADPGPACARRSSSSSGADVEACVHPDTPRKSIEVLVAGHPSDPASTWPTREPRADGDEPRRPVRHRLVIPSARRASTGRRLPGSPCGSAAAAFVGRRRVEREGGPDTFRASIADPAEGPSPFTSRASAAQAAARRRSCGLPGRAVRLPGRRMILTESTNPTR